MEALLAGTGLLGRNYTGVQGTTWEVDFSLVCPITGSTSITQIGTLTTKIKTTNSAYDSIETAGGIVATGAIYTSNLTNTSIETLGGITVGTKLIVNNTRFDSIDTTGGIWLRGHTSEPTGSEGGIYYNKTSHKLFVSDNVAYREVLFATSPVPSHTHGNITNAGAIGVIANLPLITTTSGVVTVGSFGTSANTFCVGNDARLSDARVASDVYAWAKDSVKPSYTFSEIGSKPTTLVGYGITNIKSTDNSGVVNPDNVDTNGFYYCNSVSLFGQTDGALYNQSYMTTAWQAQIFQDYRTGQIALRGRNNTTWQAWRTVLDSTNFSTYAPTKIHSLIDTTNHTVAGLTTGHYIRATGATTYAFSAIQASDVPTLNQNTSGSSASCTGNSATATKLATPRAINGVNFDGSADITITAIADANSLSGTTLKSTVVNSSLTSVGTLTSLTISGAFNTSNDTFRFTATDGYIQSVGSLIFQCDYDNNGSNNIRFNRGNGDAILTLAEDLSATFAGAVSGISTLGMTGSLSLVNGATTYEINNNAGTFTHKAGSTTFMSINNTSGLVNFPFSAGISLASGGAVNNIVTTVGVTGSDSSIPTEQAVREAISAVSGVTSVSSGNGMNFTTITSTGTVTLGTPSDITPSSTNSVSTTSHTHALTGGYLCSAKGTFNCNVADNKSATYTRVGTTVTVTLAGHQYVAGNVINCDFTSGTASDGVFVVTSVNGNDIIFTHGTSGNTSGNVTLLQKTTLRANGLFAVTHPSTGRVYINIIPTMPDAYYAYTLAYGWAEQGIINLEESPKKQYMLVHTVVRGITEITAESLSVTIF